MMTETQTQPDFIISFDRPAPMDAVAAVFDGLGRVYPQATIANAASVGGPAYEIRLGPHVHDEQAEEQDAR